MFCQLFIFQLYLQDDKCTRTTLLNYIFPLLALQRCISLLKIPFSYFFEHLINILPMKWVETRSTHVLYIAGVLSSIQMTVCYSKKIDDDNMLILTIHNVCGQHAISGVFHVWARLRGMPRSLVPSVSTRIKHHSGYLSDLFSFISETFN